MSVTPAQQTQLDIYKTELLAWNKIHNLTAIRDPQEAEIKHFQDSLTVLPYLPATTKRVVDVGTGAGFPGLVLKIMQPHLQLTLVESVGKKCKFLAHMVQTLKLEQVVILNERAEAAGQLPAHREAYDVAVARACAHLPVLSEYLLPLVKVGGQMLAMKGNSAMREVEEAQTAITLLGGAVQDICTISLAGVPDPRYVVRVNKQTVTPDRYPRRIGKPTKKPL